MDSDNSNTEESKSITYAIIEFDKYCHEDIRNWLNKKLEAPKSLNGLEFITKFTKNIKDEDVFLHICATNKRLLAGAEELGLKKLYKNDLVKDFLVEDLKNFVNSDNPDNFLNQSDCLKIIDSELSSFKIDTDKITFGKITIDRNDGIINQLIKYGLIKSIFPLHDKAKLKNIESIWYKSSYSYKRIQFIPIDKIRNYFGESIAFYFGFFEYYTLWLIPLAVLTFVTWLAPISSFLRFLICAICNLIWSTIFIEKWKRKSSIYCYEWGVFDLELTDRVRSGFIGVERINPVTGNLEKYYPKGKRTLKKYLLSYPLVALSILVAFIIMMTYYHFQHLFDKDYPDNSTIHNLLRLIPSIVYSCIVIPLNVIYKLIAVKLTDWENHRTQAIFESNLTTKLFIFYFANCFMCLFYEAFVMMNFNSLSNLLISMLVVNALVNKVTEICGPYLKNRIKKKILVNKGNLIKQDIDVYIQATALDEYEGTYSDFVTIFEQFGYITLFSAVFPWVSALAVINNIAEQRSDAFKYCRLNKRPFPRATTGIGTWIMAFEIIGLISVMSNFALISLHPEVREIFKDYNDTQYILLFVAIEHLLILIKIVIAFVIPDEPYNITNKKQKYKFELLEALKNERLARSSKIK